MEKKETNKKGLAVIFSLLGALVLVGCDGGGIFNGGGSGKVTEINFSTFQGTGGIDWIKSAADRFTTLKANESYEDGKTGVKFHISEKQHQDYDTLNSDGNDIYLDESQTDIYKLSSQGYVLDLSDVVEPLEDRIETDAKKALIGSDGKYYALPSYEWYPGISYDKDLFDAQGFYFADSSETDVEKHTSKFGNANFVYDVNGVKTVGPNGVRGDYDDGLPSSIQEFCILCDYIKTKGFSPFIIAGKASVYSFYLTTGMWASLAGGDAMRDVFCNYTSAAVDVVDGFGSDDLFYSGSGLKKPTTESVVLTDANGYRMYDMSSRYYGIAFFNLALNEEWFDISQLNDSNCEAITAQDYFIRGYNGQRYGMLYDASYWCHEAEENSSFSKYANEHPDSPDRHVSFMPFPTQAEGSVSEGNGKKPTIVNVGSTLIFANAKVASNPGKEKAVKEFLAFLYTDDELATFTETLGLTIPMDYDYDMSKLDNTYYSDLATYRQDADVIQYSSTDARFLKNKASFSLYYNSNLNRFTTPSGVAISDGYLNAIRNYDGVDAQYIFEHTKLSEAVWNGMSH